MTDIRDEGFPSPVAERTRVLRRSKRDLPQKPEELVFDIYARFSDDKQHESSIERQHEVCRAYAERIGARVNKEHADRDRTGTTMFGRDGLTEMLKNVTSGRINGILIEQVDRLSRDQADLHLVAKVCRLNGVEIHEALTGRLDDLNLTFKGYMSAAARDRLVYLVTMGLRAAAEEGRTTARPRFGYTADPVRPGIRHIHAERADDVRRLYEMYDSGMKTTDIARWMGERHPTPSLLARIDRKLALPGPSKPWSSEMIIDLLRAPIYRGVLIYGAREVVRDPHTRRITSYRETPEEEWIAVECEDLRIVDDELWLRVQKRIRSRSGVPGEKGRKPTRHLLTPVLSCGGCGAPLRVFNEHATRRVYRCTDTSTRPCGGCGRATVEWTERAVLSALGDLVGGDAVQRYRAAFLSGHDERVRDHDATVKRLRGELQEVSDALEHSFRVGAMEGASVERKRRFRQGLEQRAAEIQDQLNAMGRPDRDVASASQDAEFKAGLARLLDRLPVRAVDPETAALSSAVRGIVRSVSVAPPGSSDEIDLVMEFDLGPLVFADGKAAEALVVCREVKIHATARRLADLAQARVARDRSLDREYRDFARSVPESVWNGALDALGRDGAEIADRHWEPLGLIKPIVFLMKKGIHPRSAPSLVGPLDRLLPVLLPLVRSGGWARIEQSIREASPDLGLQLRPGLMADWTRWAGAGPGGPGASQAELSTRLAAEAACASDPRTARRLRCMSLLQAGRSRFDIVEELGISRAYFQSWTNIGCHLAGREMPNLQMADSAGLWEATGDAEFLRTTAATTSCPDLHVHCLILLSRLDGRSTAEIGARIGWSTDKVSQWLRSPPSRRRQMLARRTWYPRRAAVNLPERFAAAAASLAALAAASMMPRRATVLGAVSLHLEGKAAADVEAALGVSFEQLAVWLDVYGVLGVEGLLLSVTSPAVQCRPGSLLAEEADMLVRADELVRGADATADGDVRRAMIAVALDIRGVPSAEVCRASGIRTQSLIWHLLRHRRGGLAAVQRRNAAALLTDAQVADLRRVVAEGKDPSDPERPITLPRLLKYCEATYDRSLNMYGLRRLLRRHGVRRGPLAPRPDDGGPFANIVPQRRIER